VSELSIHPPSIFLLYANGLPACFSSAVNELMLVNGLESKTVDLTKDWIIDGERFKVTMQVLAAIKSSKKPHAYGCGIYTYRKVCLCLFTFVFSPLSFHLSLCHSFF
jgi:hypothetical protein